MWRAKKLKPLPPSLLIEYCIPVKKGIGLTSQLSYGQKTSLCNFTLIFSIDCATNKQQQHSSSAGRWMMGTITTSRSSDFEDTVYAEEFIYNLLQQ